MKQSIFKRVYIFYIIALAASIAFINFYLTNIIKDHYIEDLKNGLFSRASIIQLAMPAAKNKLDAFCRQLKDSSQTRITIIDMNGTVLCDSDNSPAHMDNHNTRPEIQQAAAIGTGSSMRHNSTLKTEHLYIAVRTETNSGVKRFIRLSVPLAQVNAYISGLSTRINLAVVLTFLSFGAILIWQTDRIRMFVKQTSEHADALAHGFLKKKLYLEEAGEFTELAHNLNNMSYELEETLRDKNEEAERLKVVLRSIPDAFLLIGFNGIIQLSNNAARELFGTDRLDGKPYLEIVRNSGFTSLIDTVKAGRQAGSAELIFDFTEERYVSVRVSPLQYRVGVLAGYVAIFHDTTRMKQLEQMRTEFVANVSHEIKTPITAIKGFAETLLDGAMYDRENAEAFLHTIKSHSERLNRLVEDLLTISRLEHRDLTINKQEFNLSDAIDHVIQTITIEAAKKDIAVSRSITGEPALILADRDRVEQILLNLADNAVKFTKAGEIEIGTGSDGTKNFFYVKDTGIGVPKKYLSRLGERFFRVDPSRSREKGGTGLGLAIVKHLVMAHGWKMGIESEEGKGTVVKVYY